MLGLDSDINCYFVSKYNNTTPNWKTKILQRIRGQIVNTGLSILVHCGVWPQCIYESITEWPISVLTIIENPTRCF